MFRITPMPYDRQAEKDYGVKTRGTVPSISQGMPETTEFPAGAYSSSQHQKETLTTP